MKKIYVAGGCFWGVQGFFKTIPGVVKTTVGYANSEIANPSYEDVSYGDTNAVEAVEVFYDEQIVTLPTLVERIMAVIDPTALNFQGPDHGTQYRNGFYYVMPEDELVIKQTIQKLASSINGVIVTEVLPLSNYFLAEEYHQDFTDKNPKVHCHIKF